MPQDIKLYNLLVSCPGDVDNELKIIKKVAKKFNDTYSDVLSITLNIKHWSTDSYNQSGGNAQELLNKQFIYDCDAAVAIFWTRFGTKTDRYGSGTEEEIEYMLSENKQVFMYFSEKPISPESLLDENKKRQYEKIKDFQRRYQSENKGIYSTYSSSKEFSDKLYAHISQHFLSLPKIEELSTKRQPLLMLKGIKEDLLTDEVYCSKYDFNNKVSKKILMDAITELYKNINMLPLGEAQEIKTVGINLFKKADLSKSVTDIISTFSEKMEIEMNSHFFNLGNLKENYALSLIGGGSLDGTKEEVKKYNWIITLHKKINDLLSWLPFESSFQNFKCIKLSVYNNGTHYDEDIEITLKLPKNSIILPKELPYSKGFSFECFPDDLTLEDMFIIESTENINDFQSSIKTATYNSTNFSDSIPINMMGRSDMKEDYYDEIDSIFDYNIYEKQKYIVLKLKMDYLKHKTATAFPTLLFIRNETFDIEYTISSKHMETQVNDCIKVVKCDET